MSDAPSRTSDRAPGAIDSPDTTNVDALLRDVLRPALDRFAENVRYDLALAEMGRRLTALERAVFHKPDPRLRMPMVPYNPDCPFPSVSSAQSLEEWLESSKPPTP